MTRVLAMNENITPYPFPPAAATHQAVLDNWGRFVLSRAIRVAIEESGGQLATDREALVAIMQDWLEMKGVPILPENPLTSPSPPPRQTPQISAQGQAEMPAWREALSWLF